MNVNGTNLNNQIQNINIANIIVNNQGNNIIRRNAESLSANSLVLNILIDAELDSDEDFTNLLNDLRNNDELPLEFRNQVFNALNPNDEPRAQLNNLCLKI